MPIQGEHYIYTNHVDITKTHRQFALPQRHVMPLPFHEACNGVSCLAIILLLLPHCVHNFAGVVDSPSDTRFATWSGADYLDRSRSANAFTEPSWP